MKKLKNKYVIIGVCILLLVVVVLSVYWGKDDSLFETAQVTFADVVQEIDVTGKIAPEEKADLAFEYTGVLAYLGVRVGDTVVKGQALGSLDSREARASYQSAQANVLAEQSRLNESERGTRTEELSISSTALSNEGRELINSARDTFTRIDTAMRATVDDLYEGGDSYYPRSILNTSTIERKSELEALRFAVTEAIEQWTKKYGTGTISVDETSRFTRESLAKSKTLVDTLWQYAKNPSTEEKDKILSAQTELIEIQRDFMSAQAEYDDAKGDYVLKRSGNTSDSVQAQRAKTEQALADAATKEAVLQKMTLVAPFDGVVTLVEPVVGETINANTIAFSVMTADRYKIEVFVPESNIAKVAIGNNAIVRLDAYGDSANFAAMVTKIDPAETVVEGVPTYKVTLSIVADPRIRSGMTADINILTAEKKNVLTVPTRALIDRKGQIFIRVVTGETYAETPIVIGLKGSNGNTEIVSGIKPGYYVRTN